MRFGAKLELKNRLINFCSFQKFSRTINKTFEIPIVSENVLNDKLWLVRLAFSLQFGRRVAFRVVANNSL